MNKREATPSDLLERYRTYDIPPQGFDPLTASDGALVRYGLPRRPDPASQPRLARLWKNAFGRRIKFVKAEITELPRVRKVPAILPGPDIPPGSWAGVYVQAPAQQSFQMVFAEWVVPTVMNWNFSGEELALGFWVGIDGLEDQQVLQAGVFADVGPAVLGTTGGGVSWSAFTQWPQGQADQSASKVSNFSVNPGDSVAVLICAVTPKLAHISFMNHSQFTYTSLSIRAPGNIALAGSTAEWIVEPSHGSSNSELLYFYEWECRNCAAATESQLFDLSPPFGATIDINVGQNSINPYQLTQTYIETATSMTVNWLGFS